MKYEELEFKIPREAEDYNECSSFVTKSIEEIVQVAIKNDRNKICISTKGVIWKAVSW